MWVPDPHPDEIALIQLLCCPDTHFSSLWMQHHMLFHSTERWQSKRLLSQIYFRALHLMGSHLPQMESLKHVAELQQKKNNQFIQAFDYIANALRKDDILFVPLKGMDLLLRLPEAFQGRFLADIDLLTAPELMAKTLVTLLRMGYYHKSKSKLNLEFNTHAVTLEHSSLPPIDLHQAPLFTQQDHFRNQRLWQRLQSTITTLDSVSMLALPETIFFMLMHGHRAYIGERNFYWISDVNTLLTRPETPREIFDLLESLALTYRLKGSLEHTLYLMKQFNLDIVENINSKVTPTSYSKVEQVLNRVLVFQYYSTTCNRRLRDHSLTQLISSFWNQYQLCCLCRNRFIDPIEYLKSIGSCDNSLMNLRQILSLFLIWTKHQVSKWRNVILKHE
ncbi:MAG: nucleotidyltransferase family protein [Deltaproteobacteria bacterium]|nr:nucleotidyltransferase family protein [Deltaproteobacteria bacterium]